MPNISKEMLEIVGVDKVNLKFEDMKRVNIFGNKLSKVNHLFKRVQE